MMRLSAKARSRLKAIKLAQMLGVVDACKRVGIDRASFYKYRRAYEAHSDAGLEDRSRAPTDHARAPSQWLIDIVTSKALEHPDTSCENIASMIRAKGASISRSGARKLLTREGLASKEQRCARLELAFKGKLQALKPPQRVAMEIVNPRLREWRMVGAKPGAVIALGTLSLGRFVDIGQVYLCAAVDTRSSYAIGRLWRGWRQVAPDEVAEVALKLFADEDGRCLTQRLVTFDDRALEPGSESTRKLNLLLARDNVARVASSHGTEVVNGFIEHFVAQARAHFVGGTVGRRRDENVPLEIYEDLQDLQNAFDKWRHSYNQQVRPGFPTYDQSPIDLASLVRSERSIEIGTADRPKTKAARRSAKKRQSRAWKLRI